MLRRWFLLMAMPTLALAGCQRSPYIVNDFSIKSAGVADVEDIATGRTISLKSGTGLELIPNATPKDRWSATMKVTDGPHAGRVVSISRVRVSPRNSGADLPDP